MKDAKVLGAKIDLGVTTLKICALASFREVFVLICRLSLRHLKQGKISFRISWPILLFVTLGKSPHELTTARLTTTNRHLDSTLTTRL